MKPIAAISLAPVSMKVSATHSRPGPWSAPPCRRVTYRGGPAHLEPGPKPAGSHHGHTRLPQHPAPHRRRMARRARRPHDPDRQSGHRRHHRHARPRRARRPRRGARGRGQGLRRPGSGSAPTSARRSCARPPTCCASAPTPIAHADDDGAGQDRWPRRRPRSMAGADTIDWFAEEGAPHLRPRHPGARRGRLPARRSRSRSARSPRSRRGTSRSTRSCASSRPRSPPAARSSSRRRRRRRPRRPS